MKLLRYLVLADTAFLMLLGFGMVLHLQPFPVVYPEARQYETIATLRVLGTAVGGLAVVVLATSVLSLLGSSRQFARWLSVANLLLAAMAGIQQQAIWGSTTGWFLFLIPLVLGAALAWVGLRPLKPGEAAAELSTLRIPEEIRQALLRQVGEAAAQEERNRLARDLHDSIKQQLFTINVSTAAAQERWERDPVGSRAALADVRRSAKEAMVEMQALLHQLRPQALASAGLVEALREQCEALGYRTGAEVTLEMGDSLPDDRLPPGGQETLFRIAQEALGNVARHARARKVHVWLGREGESALLRIEDDGQGFDPGLEMNGMGLRNLRERAEALRGLLEIRSAPGSGAKISVRVPLSPPRPQPGLQRSAMETTLEEVRRQLFFMSLPAVIFWLKRPMWSENQSYLDLGFALLYLLLIASLSVDVRLRTKSALETSPDAAPAVASLLRYQSPCNRIVYFLTGTWWAPWYWQFEQKAWSIGWTVAWGVAALVFAILTIRELPRLHRVSEPRSWPLQLGFSPAVWSWLAPVLAFAAGALLVLTFPASDPRFRLSFLSPLKPVEVLFLLFGAAVLIYVFSRQPRTEGAPA